VEDNVMKLELDWYWGTIGFLGILGYHLFSKNPKINDIKNP